MAHPLEDVMQAADGFVVIGNSADGRFPATSYAAYVQEGKRFFCLDLGGLTESRGPVKGGKVYPSVESLPKDELGDLAILWVKPSKAAEAVDVAHELGLTRIWFSFQTGRPRRSGGRCSTSTVSTRRVSCWRPCTVRRTSTTRRRWPRCSSSWEASASRWCCRSIPAPRRG